MVTLSDTASGTAGEAIKQLRELRGLSLRALAGLAKISPAALSRWETQKRVPNIPELEAVLDALQASTHDKRGVLRRINAPRAVHRLRVLDQTGAGTYAGNGGGDLLWAMRHRRGWTQTETAQAAHVAQAQIAWWENGDAWPDGEKLHWLCWALNALPEEVAALTRGKGAFLGGVKNWDNQKWLDYIAQLLHRPPPPEIFGLTLIAAEQQLGLLAADDPTRHDFAIVLLADVYAIHARHHLYHQQIQQGVHWAERGLALLRRRRLFFDAAQNGTASYWFGNVLTQATYVSQSKRPAGLRKAVRLLHDYLPVLPQNDPHYAWGQMTLASKLMALGRVNEALLLGQAACDKGEQMGASEGFQRRRDFARLLLGANQPARALDVLTQGKVALCWETSLPDTAARHRLLEAECFFYLGDKQAAGEQVRMAERIIHEQGLLHLQAELFRVAAPL